MGFRVDLETEKKVCELYKSGETIQKIADWCNITNKTVYRVIDRYGVPKIRNEWFSRTIETSIGMYKGCSKCKQSLEATKEFWMSDGKRLGCYCKRCDSEYRRNRYPELANKISERGKKYHSENREKRNAACREWHKNNPEKWKELRKKWCSEHKEWERERSKRRRIEAGPIILKDLELIREYGITLQQYDGVLLSQNNVCAICRKPETAVDSRTGKVRYLSVDHNHKFGKKDAAGHRGLLCKNCNLAIGRIDDLEIIDSAIVYLSGYTKEHNCVSMKQFRDVHTKLQNNKCKICGKPEKSINPYTKTAHILSLDHDHSMEKKDPRSWRGLICMRCNTVIGFFYNKILLLSVKRYLEKYGL
ncbi:MAG: endonuclease domain-containing protein [Candidatus Paceibacterota bacterium]